MKSGLCRITGMLALALLAATQTVRAQEPVLVKIPFDFTAGQAALPAGEYRVQNLKVGSSVILIQSTDAKAAALATSMAVSSNGPQDKTRLIFHRYGKRYFLAQVWTEGSLRGRELPISAQEKEQALTAHNEAPEQVTIIARLIAQP